MIRVAAIVNPTARNSQGKTQWQAIEGIFKKAFPSLSIHWTQVRGHAIPLTQQAIQKGSDCIISVGGDGTLNEVVNGFFDSQQRPFNPQTALAILPLGSASDAVKTLPVPTTPQQLIKAIAHRKTIPCDVGSVHFDRPKKGIKHRYFINMASFGLGAQVVLQAQAWSPTWGATLAYFLSTAALFLGTQQLPKLKLTTNQGTLHNHFFNVFLANGQYSGGGMCWAPNAQVSDGHLDLITLGKLSKALLPYYAAKLYRRKILELNEVRSQRVTHVRATCTEGDSPWVEIDGDVLGQLPATFSILPKALAIIRS